tara:strand:- start:9560 stop:10135 length:576 start_codon:yes stop_codon:yes gene_type:complete
VEFFGIQIVTNVKYVQQGNPMTLFMILTQVDVFLVQVILSRGANIMIVLELSIVYIVWKSGLKIGFLIKAMIIITGVVLNFGIHEMTQTDLKPLHMMEQLSVTPAGMALRRYFCLEMILPVKGVLWVNMVMTVFVFLVILVLILSFLGLILHPDHLVLHVLRVRMLLNQEALHVRTVLQENIQTLHHVTIL